MKFAFKAPLSSNGIELTKKENRFLWNEKKILFWQLQIERVVEVFYQVLITVIVYDILERRLAASSEGKNSTEKTTKCDLLSFAVWLIDWWLLFSRVTRFFIEIYYCYPMKTIVVTRWCILNIFMIYVREHSVTSKMVCEKGWVGNESMQWDEG